MDKYNKYNTDIQTILSSFSFPGTPYPRVPTQKSPGCDHPFILWLKHTAICRFVTKRRLSSWAGLGGQQGEPGIVPSNMWLGDDPCLRPSNISRTTVIGFQAKKVNRNSVWSNRIFCLKVIRKFGPKIVWKRPCKLRAKSPLMIVIINIVKSTPRSTKWILSCVKWYYVARYDYDDAI